jgi:hypothetical protein
MDNEQHHFPEKSNARAKIVLVVFVAIAAFFLLTEHRAHLYGYLPYLLILACPLMHLFHHGGHGGHGKHTPRNDHTGANPPTPDRANGG